MGGGYLQSTSRASQCQSGVLARVSRLKFEVELNYCCWFVNPRTRAVTSPQHSLALGDIYLNTRVISASHISHGITAPGNGCTEIKSTYTSVFEVFLHENILYIWYQFSWKWCSHNVNNNDIVLHYNWRWNPLYCVDIGNWTSSFSISPPFIYLSFVPLSRVRYSCWQTEVSMLARPFRHRLLVSTGA